MFFLNRYCIKEKYIGQVIVPDDELLMGDDYLQITTTIFTANDHFVSAILLDNDCAVFHDDLKPESTVSLLNSQKTLILYVLISAYFV